MTKKEQIIKKLRNLPQYSLVPGFAISLSIKDISVDLE